MFFSVVIPCFNSSQYIERCVNSVLAQDYDDFELIVVNDGSTDNTLEILKAYDEVNSIKVITQENQGVSIARNLGISLAQGDYIIFIDSDDWVKPGYFEFCKNQLLNSDVDILLMNHILMSESDECKTDHGLSDGEHAINDVFFASFNGKISNSPCDKVFSRKMIVDNLCFFPSGITVGEDALFLCFSLNVSKKIISTNESYYVYMQDTGGVTKECITRKKIDDITYIVRKIRELSPKIMLRSLNMMEFKQLVYYYFNYFGNGRDDLNEIFRRAIDSLTVRDFLSIKWKCYFFIIKSMKRIGILILFEIFLKKINSDE